MTETQERVERTITGTYLVTGGSGHLGANLVRKLLDEGGKVRVLLRSESDNRAVEGLDVEKVYGDLRSYEDVQKAMKGIEAVYHVAALVSTIEASPNLKREIFARADELMRPEGILATNTTGLSITAIGEATKFNVYWLILIQVSNAVRSGSDEP